VTALPQQSRQTQTAKRTRLPGLSTNLASPDRHDAKPGVIFTAFQRATTCSFLEITYPDFVDLGLRFGAEPDLGPAMDRSSF
jgi:hypothetical protein